MLIWPNRRTGMLIAVAIVSHFVLDGIVHIQGLPVAVPGSPALGLGLWRWIPEEAALEAVMAVTALILYWRATAGGRVRWRAGMVIYLVALGVMMSAGNSLPT